jgi:hypothetical protein
MFKHLQVWTHDVNRFSVLMCHWQARGVRVTMWTLNSKEEVPSLEIPNRKPRTFLQLQAL